MVVAVAATAATAATADAGVRQAEDPDRHADEDVRYRHLVVRDACALTGEVADAHTPQRPGHRHPPYGRGEVRAVDVREEPAGDADIAQRVLTPAAGVAHPNRGGELRGVAAEPRRREVVGRAGLARGRATDRRRGTGARRVRSV